MRKLFFYAAWVGPALLLQCSSWGRFWLPGNAITAYSIPSLGAVGIINGSNITVVAPTLTTITPQVAVFTTNGEKVTIAGVEQLSGITSNDYTSALRYTVTGGDGSTHDFFVSLLAPRMLGGNSLRLWLRADSLALTHGSPIAAWSDESGQANDMTQATAGQRPIFKAAAVNGYPAAVFTDAADTTMSGPDTSINDAYNGSFFIVMSVTANTNLRNIMVFHGPQGRSFDLLNAPANSFAQGRNGVGLNYQSVFDFGMNNFIAIGSVQIATTSITEVWNGDLKATSALSCCSGYDITGSGSNTNFLTNGNLEADIAEVLYFDAALSQTEQDKIFCYLNTKYNLASSRRVCES